MQCNFKNKVVVINEFIDMWVMMDEVCKVFKEGFEIGFNIYLELYELFQEEFDFVYYLVEIKYVLDEWNYKW